MITTIMQPDGEELAEAILTLSHHIGYSPLKLMEVMFRDEYLDGADITRVAPHLGLPYGQVRHIVEDIL